MISITGETASDILIARNDRDASTTSVDSPPGPRRAFHHSGAETSRSRWECHNPKDR